MRGTSLFVLAVAGLGLVAAAVPAEARSYRLMFDVFSPRGITCQAHVPDGGTVRYSQGATGNPVLLLIGNVRDARIICVLPDGSRWEAVAQQTLPAAGWSAQGIVAARTGTRATMTSVTENNGRAEVVPRSFRRID